MDSSNTCRSQMVSKHTAPHLRVATTTAQLPHSLQVPGPQIDAEAMSGAGVTRENVEGFLPVTEEGQSGTEEAQVQPSEILPAQAERSDLSKQDDEAIDDYLAPFTVSADFNPSKTTPEMQEDSGQCTVQTIPSQAKITPAASTMAHVTDDLTIESPAADSESPYKTKLDMLHFDNKDCFYRPQEHIFQRPEGVALGWGGYDQFYDFQLEGYQITPDKVEKQEWAIAMSDKIIFVNPEDPSDTYTVTVKLEGPELNRETPIPLYGAVHAYFSKSGEETRQTDTD